MTLAAIAPSLFPLAAFHDCTLGEANALLVAWEHKMGAVTRPPGYGAWAHVLTHEGAPVAVATAHTLIREHVGGGLTTLTRENTVELSRLCAARPGMNRVMLRLWREFVFPTLGYAHAISYQDATLHTGDLYRFDGWRRLALSRPGGTDQRTGREPRRGRWVWGWNVPVSTVGAVAARGVA